MSNERLTRVFDLSYEFLRLKINGGQIRVENEASLQLQLSAILKSVGELLEKNRDEYFFIELEKSLTLKEGVFGKSGTANAKVDIFCGYINAASGDKESCAIELKYFKKNNHREPNNRYDVFADIHNLENYGFVANCCFMVVATDHDHYVSQKDYSLDTGDFDFREGQNYVGGTEKTYRRTTPYGKPITLASSYNFLWDTAPGGVHFLKLAVQPRITEA